MSVAERKEREKQRRRNEIIDAAEKRFFECGFDGVSMDDIALDLELSKPTLYLYFKSKESLFLAVVTRGMLIFRDMFRTAVAPGVTGLAQTRGFMRTFFDYAAQYPEYYKLLMAVRTRRFVKVFSTGEVEGADEFGEISQEVLDLLMDAIRLGQRDGTMRKDLDPVETAIFLCMACESAIHLTPEWESLLKANARTIDRYYEHSLDILLHGIALENPRK